MRLVVGIIRGMARLLGFAQRCSLVASHWRLGNFLAYRFEGVPGLRDGGPGIRKAVRPAKARGGQRVDSNGHREAWRRIDGGQLIYLSDISNVLVNYVRIHLAKRPRVSCVQMLAPC